MKEMSLFINENHSVFPAMAGVVVMLINPSLTWLNPELCVTVLNALHKCLMHNDLC